MLAIGLLSWSEPPVSEPPAAAPVARAEPGHRHAPLPGDDTDGPRDVYFEGKGWATVVDPGPDAQAPPPLGDVPTSAGTLPEEPMVPPDAAWELEKAEQTRDLLVGRLDRLEQAISDAERAGNAERAGQRRVLLERTKSRLADLDEELEALRAAAADTDA